METQSGWKPKKKPQERKSETYISMPFCRSLKPRVNREQSIEDARDQSSQTIAVWTTAEWGIQAFQQD